MDVGSRPTMQILMKEHETLKVKAPGQNKNVREITIPKLKFGHNIL